MTLLDALVVGVAQIGALIPGVSRSGSTLTAALFLDLKREEAARFSFLLGIPAIALAGLKELYELHKAHLDSQGWSILAVGLVVGSISAFVAISLLMRILERFSTWPFVIYRAVDRHSAALRRRDGLADLIVFRAGLRQLRNGRGNGYRARRLARSRTHPWSRSDDPPRSHRRTAHRPARNP